MQAGAAATQLSQSVLADDRAEAVIDRQRGGGAIARVGACSSVVRLLVGDTRGVGAARCAAAAQAVVACLGVGSLLCEAAPNSVIVALLVVATRGVMDPLSGVEQLGGVLAVLLVMLPGAAALRREPPPSPLSRSPCGHRSGHVARFGPLPGRGALQRRLHVRLSSISPRKRPLREPQVSRHRRSAAMIVTRVGMRMTVVPVLPAVVPCEPRAHLGAHPLLHIYLSTHLWHLEVAIRMPPVRTVEV